MSDLEISITKLLDIKEDPSTSAADMMSLRDHLIEVYSRVGVSLLKRQQVYDEKLTRQEQEWRATCDKLIEDHHEMKQESKLIDSIINTFIIKNNKYWYDYYWCRILIHNLFIEEALEFESKKTIKRLEQ